MQPLVGQPAPIALPLGQPHIFIDDIYIAPVGRPIIHYGWYNQFGFMQLTIDADIRPNIESISVEPAGETQSVIRVKLNTVDGRGAKIREVLEEMGCDFSQAQTVRVNTRFTGGLELGAMGQGIGESFGQALPFTSTTQEVR